MKKIGILVHLLVFFAAVPSVATDLCGNVSGTLTQAGNPYIVTCDIAVPLGQTLILEEGIEMRFAQGTAITVHGCLNVNGSAGNKVMMTSNAAVPQACDWGGISTEENASITGCVVRYACEGIDFSPDASMTVSDSTFEFCMQGIMSYESGTVSKTISGCVFNDNDDGGIRLYDTGPSLSVSSCAFNRNPFPGLPSTRTIRPTTASLLNPVSGRSEELSQMQAVRTF